MTPGVVLLHGHGRLGASIGRLARAARAAGYATLSPNYPYRRSLAQVVDWLTPRVAAFGEGVGPLHFVTHSFGGLVARAVIEAARPARLGRVVTLAPPHGGSELADLLFRLNLARPVLGHSHHALRTARDAAEEALLGRVDYSLGVIAGDRPVPPLPFAPLPRPHDGKVSVAATHIAGEADHLLLPVAHTFMVYDAAVIAQTLHFLATGGFDHNTRSASPGRGSQHVSRRPNSW